MPSNILRSTSFSTGTSSLTRPRDEGKCPSVEHGGDARAKSRRHKATVAPFARTHFMGCRRKSEEEANRGSKDQRGRTGCGNTRTSKLSLASQVAGLTWTSGATEALPLGIRKSAALRHRRSSVSEDAKHKRDFICQKLLQLKQPSVATCRHCFPCPRLGLF